MTIKIQDKVFIYAFNYELKFGIKKHQMLKKKFRKLGDLLFT
jgi:hypothetical protein